jgi:hypothetical protein
MSLGNANLWATARARCSTGRKRLHGAFLLRKKVKLGLLHADSVNIARVCETYGDLWPGGGHTLRKQP